MATWVYKVNRHGVNGPDWGDWEDVFSQSRPVEWGRTTIIPALNDLRVGDELLCFQTDRNELVGLARVVGFRRIKGGRRWLMQATRRIGAKVRPLKTYDPRIARIEALKGGPIATIYPISKSEAARLIKAADMAARKASRGAIGRTANNAGRDLQDALTKAPGFEQDPEVRRAIELHAMERAELWYSERYRVRVKGKPYDLHCSRGAQVLLVEVKGTRSSGSRITLTKNEVERARTDKMELFVLHSIRIKRSNGRIQAVGGVKRVIAPWRPTDTQLSPIAFTCQLGGRSQQ